MRQRFTVLFLLLFACVGESWGQYSLEVEIDGVTQLVPEYTGGTATSLTICEGDAPEFRVVGSPATACTGAHISYYQYDLYDPASSPTPVSSLTPSSTYTATVLGAASVEVRVSAGCGNGSSYSPEKEFRVVFTVSPEPSLAVAASGWLCEDASGAGSNLTPSAGSIDFTITGCVGCSNYGWTFSNGYTDSNSGNVLSTDYNTVRGTGAPLSNLQVTSISATDVHGCFWDENISTPVDVASSPSLSSLIVPSIICEDPVGVTVTPAASMVDLICTDCGGVSWDLMFSNGHSSTGVLFPYTVSYTDVFGASDVSAVANIGGCSWTSALEPISLGAAPFTDFVVPESVIIQGVSPEDVTDYLQPSASAGASYSLDPSSVGLLVGEDYYPIQLGAAILAVSETTLAGCTYSDQVAFDVVDQFNLLNLTNPLQEREVCVGDNLQVLVYNIPGNPSKLRFSAAAGGTIDVAIAAGDLTSLGGSLSKLDKTITVPDTWASGLVEILDNSNTVLLSSSQSLIVNNPSLGLAFAKNPICYSDKVAVYGQPAGGTLLAYDLPGNVANTNLLTNISGVDYVDASQLALTDIGENHEIEQIRVEYSYTPTYSDGSSCSSPRIIGRNIDVRDDRLFTAFLPDVVEDQLVYDLGASISAIYPQPMGTMATKSRDFSGTYVQSNGSGYEFLPQAAGAGFHPLEFSIENSGGCSAVGGAAVHVLAKPSEEALVDTICSTIGTFDFSRAVNLPYSPLDPNFATVNRADCGQEVSGLRPMAAVSGGGRQLGQNLYADSSIQLPLGAIWVGDSSYFAYNSNLQQAARLGCTDVLAMKQERERYQITKVAAFANDGGLPPDLVAIQAGTNEITGADVSSNLNGASEQLALNIDVVKSAIRTDPSWDNNKFYVVVLYQDSYQNHYYEEDGVTVRSTSPSENSFTYSVEEVYLLDSEGLGVQASFASVHCYNDGVVQLPLFPAFNSNSTLTIEQVSSGAALTINSDQLDFNDPFFSSTADENYKITYNYQGYEGCAGTLGGNNPGFFQLNAPTVIDFSSLYPSNVCENGTATLNATPIGGIFTGIGVTNTASPGTFDGSVAGVQIAANNVIYYQYEDADGCSTIDSTTIFVDEAPEIRLLRKDPLCRASTTSLINLGDTAHYEVECLGLGCSGVLYTWEIDGVDKTPSTQGATASYSLSDLSHISTSSTSATLVVDAENNVGCRAILPVTDNIEIGEAPFTGLSLPTTISQSSNCVDIEQYITGVASTSPAIHFDYGFGTNRLGSISANCYYPTDFGGVDIYVVGHHSSGCSYRGDGSTTVIQDYDFTNHTTATATVNWEACVGDEVTITVSNLSFVPTAIEILQQDGSIDRRDFTNGGITATFNQNSPFSGSVRFVIQPTDASGGISLVDTPTNSSYVVPHQIVINNPPLSIFTGKTPICYDDTIKIYGQPANGAFTAYEYNSSANSYSPNYAMVEDDSILYGNKWTIPNAVQNNGGGIIRLEYKYLPTYINGTSCPDSIVKNQDFSLHDNRLTSAYFPIVYIDSTGTYDLGENIKNIFPEPVSPYFGVVDTTFRGTFVQLNSITGGYEFLTAAAGSGSYTLDLEMNKGGCIARTEIHLYIQEEAKIPSFPSTICASVDSVGFVRDSSKMYAVEIDTLFQQGRPVQRYRSTVNRLVKVEAFADDGTVPTAAISATNSPKLIPNGIDSINGLNTSNEEFRAMIGVIQNFITNNPTYSDSSFYIGMHYESIRTTEYFDSTGTMIDSSQAIVTDTEESIAVQLVKIVDLAPISIIDSLLDSYYCSSELGFPVQTLPAYEVGFSNLSVRSIGLNPRTHSLPSGILDIKNDSFFIDSLDRSYIISYEYSKAYGCDMSANTDTFTVVAPIAPSFTHPQSSYCVNSSEVTLSGQPGVSTGMGGTFSGSGIGVNNTGAPSSGDMFAPTEAGVGVHNITYLYQDLYGCESEVTQQIEVFEKPVVSLTADHANLIYCASDTAAYLIGYPDTLNGGTGVYSGISVIGDNVFHPNQVLLGSANVTYTYIDSIGCENSATVSLQIQTPPRASIQNLDTAYCQNSGSVTIVGVDQAGQGTSSSIFYSNGISGNIYSPSTLGVGVDTVKYVHTNIYGCKDSVIQEVHINPVPSPSYTGLNTTYCINDTATLLVGSPILPPLNAIGASAYFQGPGVTFDVANREYFFDPLVASQQAATGQSIFISYTYTNAHGCTEVVTDSTRLIALPQANFGINSSYCLGTELDTLSQNIVGGPFSVALFQGPGIIDQNLGVLSTVDAARTDTFGLQTITMYFEDSSGCSNQISRNYILEDLPVVDLIGLDRGHCKNGNLIEFQGFPVGNVIQGGNAAYMTNIPMGSAFNITASADARASIDPTSDSVNVNMPYYVIYQYTDGNQCTNFDTVQLEFFDPPQPIITQLDSQYCEVQDTILMQGAPSGGDFGGSGTAQGTNFFLPFRAGGGVHNISYSVQDTNVLSFDNTTLVVCRESAMQTVQVRPLPVPFIASPGDNAAFCESDSAIRVLGQIQNMGSLQDSFYYGTGVVGQYIQVNDTIIDINGNSIPIVVSDSIYFFDPSIAGPGIHDITYMAGNNFGCIDSVTYSYTVYPRPTPDFIVDSTYCESDGGQLLVGTPVGGVFLQNGDSLASPLYNPNPLYPSQLYSAVVRDTLTYVVSNARCVSSTTKIVEVNPNPIVSFIGQSRLSGDTTSQSCLGRDTIQLHPNIAGGEFTGSGVIFQSPYFVSNLAGVGGHPVKYGYTDPITGCYDEYLDTFMVYSTPNIVLSSTGACDDTLTTLRVDNSILGLNGFFQGQIFDSITMAQWNFGDGNLQSAIGTSAVSIDSVVHQYSTPREYDVILSVENRGFCVDRDTLRIFVSPYVQPTALAPYYEDFNAGAGYWVAESEFGPNSSNLWEWGTATGNVINTVQDTHQNVWATRLNGAAGANDGWVYGPCVDLRGLSRPMISLDYVNDTDEGNDGTVIEYFDEDLNQWMPLGHANRGINWYYDGIVAGQPGNQVLAPEGWSGSTGGDWTNGRYSLDDFAHYDKFRFRIAFGSTGVSQTREGFAFDNVWIGNRSRNVLLEHFSNYGMYAGVDFVNQYVYNLAYATPAVKDVVLVQYNIDFPRFDVFNADNTADPSARTIFYGISEAGKAVVDGERFGQTAPYSQTLSQFDFEQDMLETPKFTIDPIIQIFNGSVSISTDVIANEDMPVSDYYLQTMILEDSMSYNTGERVHSVLRKALPDAGGSQMQSTFAAGEVFNYSDTLTFNTNEYNYRNLSVVLFVQESNSFSREVFQVHSSRDISRYVAVLGTEEAEAALAKAEPLENMKLYPNPAREWVRIEFDGPIEADYNWKVVDLQGRTLRQGQLQAGEQALELQNLNEFAAGMYFFVVDDPKFTIQRKFVVYRP